MTFDVTSCSKKGNHVPFRTFACTHIGISQAGDNVCSIRRPRHAGDERTGPQLQRPETFTCGRAAAGEAFTPNLDRPVIAAAYSTSPRNGNPVNGNHLDICLSFSQKNGNSLTWVLVALTVCFTCPVLYRVSSESRAGEWEL